MTTTNHDSLCPRAASLIFSCLALNIIFSISKTSTRPEPPQAIESLSNEKGISNSMLLRAPPTYAILPNSKNHIFSLHKSSLPSPFRFETFVFASRPPILSFWTSVGTWGPCCILLCTACGNHAILKQKNMTFLLHGLW